MEKLKLGQTDIEVTDWCLGTMTYARHTLDDDAHAQIDMSLDHGINFLDVAEMYPVNPATRETMGDSEKTLGRWFKKTGRRDEVVLATKVAGDGGLRPGGYNRQAVNEALDASLSRLETDYVDLYQLHWPNRGSYHFRQNWQYDPTTQDRQQTIDNMVETLEALGDAVKAGKIRAVGLSNETAWGTMMWLSLAEKMGLPRMATMQNEYSLLCRHFDLDVGEVCHHEDITLLSYSPLAAGLLTGKYQNGVVPEGSRMDVNGDLGGRRTDRAFVATQVYLDIATKHGLDLVHMSMAWQRARPHKISAIFGATKLEQLEHILKGKDLTLSSEVLDEIEAAHKAHPLPY